MTAPRARLLAIGDELLFGRTVDTNSAWLARRLTDLGLEVDRVQVVGDGQAAIEAALRAAVDGAALVLVSGGLGPTEDDRTRHALASVAGVPLVERADAWRQVRAWFGRHRPGQAVAASNRRQALAPRGARLLRNHRGTAPGLLQKIGSAWVACYPGVPHEMQAMHQGLEPALTRLVPGVRAPAIGELWFAGLGESAAQERISDLFTERDPQVGITVSELGHITLRVLGRAVQVRRRVAALSGRLRPWLLPQPGPAASLVEVLTRAKATLALAESCTGGHIAAQITAVPGSSAVLRASLVAYQEEAKRRLLGVPPALIAAQGVVSEEVALAMARGAQAATGADLALATTGIAGPGGGTPRQPVGTVCFAAVGRGRTITRTISVPGARERVQARAAAHALLLGWELWQGRTGLGAAPRGPC